MRASQRSVIAFQRAFFSVPIGRNFICWGIRGRALALALLSAAACGSAVAQYVGYVANSADGTVSVFAVVTSGPQFGSMLPPGNEDDLIATIAVGKNPSRIAVTPLPNSNLAYVTNSGDNSLWVIDVTKISQQAVTPGSITAQNVNTASNGLQLNKPGGIAIVSTTQSGTTRILAFVANQGNNTVSVIDTSTNKLLGTVNLGTAGGSSTTLPEVAATPDGTQIFVTNNSTVNCPTTSPASGTAFAVASSTPCAGLWAISTATAPKGTATPIPVSGFFRELSVNLMQARGVSATQYAEANKQIHTLLLVADSGQAFCFLVDIRGTTTIVQPVAVGKVATVGGVLMNFAGVEPPASVSAAVITEIASGPNGVELFPVTLPLSCCTTAEDALEVTGSVDSLAVVNPGAATQFIYMTETTGGAPIAFASFDNALNLSCASVATSCNSTTVTVGKGPTGITFSTLDANSPPVAWFIPIVSGGFGPPPPLVPANSPLNLLGESMVGAGQTVNTKLSFGGTNPCTLFGTETTGPTCTNSASGANAIGGNTTFPASGVFTVSITNGSTDSSENATSTTIQQEVSVGANCTVSVTPTNIIVGETVQATASCTAPLNDQLAGMVQWGDGTTSESPNSVPANGINPVTLSFSHTYKSLSPSGGWPLNVTVTDTTSNFAANISTTQPIPVAVKAPSCTLVVTPNPTPLGETVTATMTCQGAATDAFTGTVNWGDGTPVSPPSSMAGSGGMFTLSLTHIYSSPSSPTFAVSATATDSSLSIAGVFSNLPINVAVGLACGLSVTPTTVGTGATVTVNLNCTASPGHALSGTLSWGDGTTTPLNLKATANGTATLSVTHVYSTPSNPTYAISATLTDTVLGLSVIVNPPSVAVTAATPGKPKITSPSPQPQTIVAGQSVTVPFTISGGAADAGITFSISCQVSPAGPTCSVSPSTLTLDANGNGTVQVTITTIGPGTTVAGLPSGSREARRFAALIALPGLGLMLLGSGILGSGRRRRVLLLSSFLCFICIAMFVAACGTSIQRSNLACTTCTRTGTYTVTVTALSQTPTLQSSGVFTIVVQ